MRDRTCILGLVALFIVSTLWLIRIHGPNLFFIADGDDETYYSYARALVIDHNLSFKNVPLVTFQKETDKKRLASFYAIGPGLLWTPFVALGHLTARLTFAVPADLVMQGISPIEWVSACIGSMLYALSGFLLLYLFLRRSFDPEISFWSVFLVGFSSPLVYYIFRRPLMAHANEFFCLSAAAYLISGLESQDRWQTTILAGMMTGLLFLNRWIDTPFVIAYSLWGFWRLRATDQSWFRIRAKQLGFLIAVGGIAGIQLIVWKYLSGSFFPGVGMYQIPMLPRSIVLTIYPWTLRHLCDLFTGQDWGIFWLSPVTLMAVIFAVPSIRKNPRRLTRWVLLLPSFATFWIAANWPGHGGEYGNRYLLGSWLLFVYLFAESMEGLQPQPRLKRAFIGIGGVCFLYSLTALSLFKSNADSLTLALGPTPYGLPSDWVNSRYTVNAFHQMIHAPIQTLMTIGPSPAGVFLMRMLQGLGMLPAHTRNTLDAYLYKHPMPDASTWVFFFIALGFGVLFISRWATRHCERLADEK